MSHAANLRRRDHSSPNAAPAKRRKLSSDTTPPHINGKNNGLSNGFVHNNFKADTFKDAKVAARARFDEIDATMARGDEDIEMKNLPNGTTNHVNGDSKEGASDEESDQDEEEDDSGDGEEYDQEVQDGQEEEEETTHGSKELPSQILGINSPMLSDQRSEAQLDTGILDNDQPTFGDLLKAKGIQDIQTKYIDTTATSNNLQEDPSNDLVPLPNRQISIPSAASLGSVLTQALRSDDSDLLESCFQVPQLDSIRATIERLPSRLAANLLHKLAERLHRRPGRAGSLMVWVQWTIVAHGGYLAGQSSAMKELQVLYQVVTQRATALQPLLALKGKLDMLEAQLQLRRKRASGGATRGQEEEAAVVYIEGEEEGDESDGAVEAGKQIQEMEPEEQRLVIRNRKRRLLDDSLHPSSGEGNQKGLLANGVSEDEDGAEEEDLDNEDDSSEEGSDSDLIDDEASEDSDLRDSDDLNADDEDIDYSDADDILASSDEDEGTRLPKSSSSKKSKGKK